MGDYDEKKPILANISYHDYIVLICDMEAEWTRRRPSLGAKDEVLRESFFRPHLHFTRKCCKYRDYIDGNYRKFYKANKDFVPGDSEGPVKPYLYNPVCYTPFGHPDNMAFVLLDDFDPVEYIMSEFPAPIEKLSLAFCPTCESLDLDKNIFSNLDELIKGKKQRRPKKRMINNKTVLWPAEHEFQETTPLLAFTKFKMHGLMSTGQSLLLQQALFKTMATKIKNTLRRLRLRCHSTEDKFKKKHSVKELMRKKDIDSVKCSFLDLQGSEEIGLLIFCRNYSVAMTLIGALRSLTFGNIFKANNNIKKILDQSICHKYIIRLKNLSEPSYDVNALKELHAFRWTQTSMSVSSHTGFDAEKKDNYNGYLNAFSEIQVSPGHLRNVQEIVSQNKPCPKLKKFDAEKCYLYRVGIGDVIMPYSATPGDKIPLIPVGVLLESLKQNLVKFGLNNANGDGRDIVDLYSSLTVPIPKIIIRLRNGTERDIILGSATKPHSHFLADALRKTQSKLWLYDPIKGQPRDKRSGKTDIDINDFPLFPDYKKIRHKCGIPISLWRSTEHLFQNYAILFAHPFLFDVAISLHDVFESLYNLLTKYLPEACKSEFDNCVRQNTIFLLDDVRTNQLADLVDVIHNALMHRIAKTYPESSVRQMAVDFCGGLNQIMFAADAPVKCGQKLFQNFLAYPNIQDDSDVGILTRITFRPTTCCHSLYFGVRYKVRFAYFDVDILRALHPAGYTDFLHESFHLIFDAFLEDKIKSGCSLLKELSENEVMLERMSEIFAILLSHLFLFDVDSDTFFYHYLCSYSASQSNSSHDDCECLFSFVEIFFRLFVAADAIPQDGRPEDWSDDWIQKDKDIGEVAEKFEKKLNYVGRFFSEYNRLWPDSGKRKEHSSWYCLKEFRDIYPEVSKYMPALWSMAKAIYINYCKEDFYAKDIRTIASKALEKGKPLVGSLNPGSTKKHEAGRQSLAITCALLYEYIQNIKIAADKDYIHLCRSRNNKNPVYAEGKWYEFQVDKGASSMFSPVPSARRRRLKKQIVMLKTFWNISSGFRAESLEKILAKSWPKLTKF